MVLVVLFQSKSRRLLAFDFLIAPAALTKNQIIDNRVERKDKKRGIRPISTLLSLISTLIPRHSSPHSH
jgi:accessory gene regulator protein AgrB